MPIQSAIQFSFSLSHPQIFPFQPPMSASIKRKSEMSPEELKDLEERDLSTGPFASLATALQTRSQILISCRNNKKLLAKVKAFDRHFNMILEEVREIWTDPIRKRRGSAKKTSGVAMNKDRYISKMFLRGDSVVLVVLAPPPPSSS